MACFKLCRKTCLSEIIASCVSVSIKSTITSNYYITLISQTIFSNRTKMHQRCEVANIILKIYQMKALQ